MKNVFLNFCQSTRNITFLLVAFEFFDKHLKFKMLKKIVKNTQKLQIIQ